MLDPVIPHGDGIAAYRELQHFLFLETGPGRNHCKEALELGALCPDGRKPESFLRILCTNVGGLTWCADGTGLRLVMC